MIALLPYKKCVFSDTVMKPFHLVCSCTYIYCRVSPYSSIQTLTANYLDSCFLPALTLPIKEISKANEGLLSEILTLGQVAIA